MSRKREPSCLKVTSRVVGNWGKNNRVRIEKPEPAVSKKQKIQMEVFLLLSLFSLFGWLFCKNYNHILGLWR